MSGQNKQNKKVARKKIRLLDPGTTTPRVLPYEAAMELVRSTRREGSYDMGNHYLEQVARQIPGVAEPSIYLLHTYIDAMRLDEARLLADSLRDRFPALSAVMRVRARFHEMAGELSRARQILEQAVSIHPRNAENLESMAAFYQSIGERQRAIEHYERALVIDPYFGVALLGKARLVGVNATDDFIEQIKSAIRDGNCKGVKLASLYFALAFIYEDKDIELHVEYLHEANRVMAADRHFDVDGMRKYAENTIYRFREDVVKDLRGLIDDDFKPIFVVGLPRSGTTLLEQIIGAHPECEPIGESSALTTSIDQANELGCPPMDASSPEAREQCREYLQRLAQHFRNNRLVGAVGDKCPVSKSMGVHMFLGLACLALPNARIIHVERHPLAVIYSCYKQAFASGNNFSYRLEWMAEYYKIFRLLMDHWNAVFPERIHTVHYEHLVRDKTHEIEKILNFCDLPLDEACLHHERSVHAIMTASDNQVRRPVYKGSMERWKKVESHLEPAKAVLGEWLEYSA